VCSVACPREGILQDIVRKQCNGTGNNNFNYGFIENVNLQFIRQHGHEAKANNKANSGTVLGGALAPPQHSEQVYYPVNKSVNESKQGK
jgi:hypothetical protein